MDDEIIEGEETDSMEQESAKQPTCTPDSDEMNLFVLDMYDRFKLDPGHAITEFEFNNLDDDPRSSSAQTLKTFIALIKTSEKLPQMYQEMSNDELHHLV